MLRKSIYSNENFRILVTEGMISKWDEFELVRKNFRKSKENIIKTIKGNVYGVDRGDILKSLNKIDSKIIFNNLNIKSNLKYTYNYFKIKENNGKYKCELCGQPRIKLIGCHIVKEIECKKRFKRFNDSIINRLFMCSNCHDDTEKHWKEIKNKKRLKKEIESKIKKLLGKRKPLKIKIIKNLKSDINEYKKRIKLIDNIKKEVENYKKQNKNINYNFNKKRKKLNNEIKQKKNKISKEIENLIKRLRKKYDNRINKIRKRHKNPKIINKRLNGIRKQKGRDIDKKRKIEKEEHRKQDKIKKQKLEQLKLKRDESSEKIYRRFKDKIKKIVKEI